MSDDPLLVNHLPDGLKDSLLLQEKQQYYLKLLPWHLFAANDKERLAKLLTDFSFIQRKVKKLGSQALGDDYSYLQDDGFSNIRRAILLFSHLITQHPDTSLESQLYGRLIGLEDSNVYRLLSQIKNSANIWLRHINLALMSPQSLLIRTISSQTDAAIAIALDENNQHLIVSYQDGKVIIWNLVQLMEEEVLIFESPVLAIAIVGDNLFLGEQSGYINIWNMRLKEKTLHLLAHSGQVNGLLNIPSTNILISHSIDQIRAWMVPNSFDLAYKLDISATKCLSVSADKYHFISGHADGLIRFWNVSDGTTAGSWTASVAAINNIHSLKSLERVVTFDSNMCTVVWDYRGNIIWKDDGFSANFESDKGSLAISEDDKFLAQSFGSRNTLVRILNMETGIELDRFEAHSWPITDIKISFKGNQIFTCSQDARIKIWKLLSTSGGGIPKIKHSDDVSDVCISPDGSLGVSCSLDGTARLWNMNNGESVKTISEPGSFVYKAQFSVDGQLLILGCIPGTLHVLNLEDEKNSFHIEKDINSYADFVITLDSRRVIAIADDKLFEFNLDVSTVPKIYRFAGNIFSRIFIDSHGSYIFLVSHKNDILVLNSISGELKWTLHGHTDAVTSVICFKEIEVLVSTSEDGTLCIWDLSTGELRYEMLEHNGNIKDLVAIPGNWHRVITASSDGTLKIWDIDVPKVIITLKGHNNIVWRARSSYSGETAISISGDESVIVWDLNTGDCLTRLSLENRPTCCALSLDGRKVIVGEMGGNVHILSLHLNHP